MMDPIIKEHLERAVTHHGGETALARAIGRSQSYVWFLRNNAKKVPGEVAIAIERSTKGVVSKQQLCPNLWPEPSEGAEPPRGRGPEATQSAA